MLGGLCDFAADVDSFLLSDFVEVGVDGADEEGAPDDVADCGGDEVAPDGFPYAYVGSLHHSEGDEEHVGDGVFVAEGHESHDGEPAAEGLLKECLSGECEPHGEADTPVGAYAFYEHREPRHRDLGLGD